MHNAAPVEAIQRAISELSRTELAELRAWFATFDAEAWDREWEEDAAAGRLDALADEAWKTGGWDGRARCEPSAALRWRGGPADDRVRSLPRMTRFSTIDLGILVVYTL